MGSAARGGGSSGGRVGRVLSGIVVAAGMALFLGGFAWGALTYRPYTVPTSSMTPTIDAGDRVMAQRIQAGDIRRGDVVVFRDKSWVTNADVVKRVVAVGGDKVSCCTDGKLTVNGRRIEEPYLPKGSLAEIGGFPSVTVPRGRLFLLGDERQGSLDSTAHLTDSTDGTVSRGAVSARVDAVVWPMKGMIKRPTGFEVLGTLSRPGPLRAIGWMIAGGAVLVLLGAAYGPVASRVGRSRTRTAPEPARAG